MIKIILTWKKSQDIRLLKSNDVTKVFFKEYFFEIYRYYIHTFGMMKLFQRKFIHSLDDKVQQIEKCVHSNS